MHIVRKEGDCMNNFEVKITDNTKDLIQQTEDVINVALEKIGITAERHAKKNLGNTPKRVDTGNLRNNVTHAVDEVEHEAIVGTNVEYGIYVHEGTRRMQPNRFLRNAIEEHVDEYMNVIEKDLKKLQ